MYLFLCETHHKQTENLLNRLWRNECEARKKTHELWIIFEWHEYLRQREKYEMSVQKLAVSFFLYTLTVYVIYVCDSGASVKKQMKALIMCVITRLTNNMPRNETQKAQAHFSLFSLLSLLCAIHYNNFHENHYEPYFFFFSSFFCQSLLCHSFFYFHSIWKSHFLHLGIYIMNSLR